MAFWGEEAAWVQLGESDRIEKGRLRKERAILADAEE